MFPHGKMYSVNRFRFAEELGTVMPVKKSGSNLGKDRAGEVTAGLDEEVKLRKSIRVSAAGEEEAARRLDVPDELPGRRARPLPPIRGRRASC